MDRCEDFLAQVKKEHVAEHYTFAELEENEVDLDKLQKWFDRVQQRDVFGASGRQAVEKALARARSRWRSTRPGSTPRKSTATEPAPPSSGCAVPVRAAFAFLAMVTAMR